jgi:hypothetical protein
VIRRLALILFLLYSSSIERLWGLDTHIGPRSRKVSENSPSPQVLKEPKPTRPCTTVPRSSLESARPGTGWPPAPCGRLVDVRASADPSRTGAGGHTLA